MAAPLGFKTFTVGEVLSAADVNGYLMQGVLVFATTAARDAAITSPQEGQFAFTKDTNSLFYYDGAAWVASGATGDIEGVTAGTGISGGGTSGTVTVTNSMATAIDAKGDLVVGTGADAFSRLAVGTNTHVLTADSAEATGLKWAAPAGGGGKVLQVIYASSSTEVGNSTTTFADTTLSATITPSSASSKVLILVSHPDTLKNADNSGNSVKTRLLRGATAILDPITSFHGYTNSALNNTATISSNYLDSPATTSATTYKTQFANRVASSTVYININGTSTATMILMEIGA